MDNAQARDLIPELDEYATRARQFSTELEDTFSKYQQSNANIREALSKAYMLPQILCSASEDLKRTQAHYVTGYVTDWYHWRLEDDDMEITDPTIEHINYKGNDVWEVVINTTTHGREKLVVHSNAATWEQLYSIAKLD